MSNSTARFVCRLFLATWVFPCSNCLGDFITNGSFEEPPVPNGVFLETPPSLPGWVATSPRGLGDFNLHGTIWASQDGVQHVEFDSPISVLEQTVTGLNPGAEYEVAFGLTGNPDRQAIYGLSLEVFDSSSLLATDSYSVSSIGSTRATVVWTEESLRFVATGASARIVFSRTDGGPDGWGPDLDNVRLNAVVPEPTSAMLLITGAFALVGWRSVGGRRA